MTSQQIDWQIKALSKKRAELGLRMSRNTVNTQKDISAAYSLDGLIRKKVIKYNELKEQERQQKFEAQ